MNDLINNNKHHNKEVQEKIFSSKKDPNKKGRYIGTLIDGKREGRGIIRWDNGDIYNGEWKNDKNRFLEDNYSFFDLAKSQEFITRINQLPLTKDEKLKIINYKPENIVEISVVSIKYNNDYIIY